MFDRRRACSDFWDRDLEAAGYRWEGRICVGYCPGKPKAVPVQKL